MSRRAEAEGGDGGDGAADGGDTDACEHDDHVFEEDMDENKDVPKEYAYYKLFRTDREDENEFYVGSTVDIIERMRHHENRCRDKKYRKSPKLYDALRIDGWAATKCDIIERSEGKILRAEARKREDELIKEHGATLNMIRAFRSAEEKKAYHAKESRAWDIAHPEQAAARFRAWAIANPTRKKANDAKRNAKRLLPITCTFCEKPTSEMHKDRHEKTKYCRDARACFVY